MLTPLLFTQALQLYNTCSQFLCAPHTKSHFVSPPFPNCQWCPSKFCQFYNNNVIGATDSCDSDSCHAPCVKDRDVLNQSTQTPDSLASCNVTLKTIISNTATLTKCVSSSTTSTSSQTENSLAINAKQKRVAKRVEKGKAIKSSMPNINVIDLVEEIEDLTEEDMKPELMENCFKRKRNITDDVVWEETTKSKRKKTLTPYQMGFHVILRCWSPSQDGLSTPYI